ncbi:MAG: DUF6089 family protein [Saprospiraceae bacterium]
MIQLKLRFFTFSFFVLFLTTLSNAQSSVGIHLGLSNYLGDIVPSSITLDNAQLSFGAFYRYHASEKFALRANVMLGQLKGDDNDYDERKNRGYSFETGYTQLSLLGEYHFNGKPRYDEDGVFQKNTTFYLLAGIGGTIVNPETSGLPMNAPELAEDYSTFAFTIPVGLGVQFPLSEQLLFGAEIGAGLVFSDYLDGISESANPDQNDNMGHFELNLAYYFGGK